MQVAISLIGRLLTRAVLYQSIDRRSHWSKNNLQTRLKEDPYENCALVRPATPRLAVCLRGGVCRQQFALFGAASERLHARTDLKLALPVRPGRISDWRPCRLGLRRPGQTQRLGRRGPRVQGPPVDSI